MFSLPFDKEVMAMKKLMLSLVAACAALVGFAGVDSWTYDPDAKTLTWGDNVVVNVTANNKNLTIGDNRSNELAVDLDFSKPIDGDYQIVQINNSSFTGHTKLTRLIAPASLKTIQWNAVDKCLNLTTLELNEGLTTLGDQSFASCTSLTTFGHLPSTLTTYGGNAFSGCTSLAGEVVWPQGLKTYSANFTGTQISSIDLSMATALSGYAPFKGCAALTSIVIGADVAKATKRMIGDMGSGLTVHVWWRGVPTTVENELFAGTSNYRIVNHFRYSQKEQWEALAATLDWYEFVFPEAVGEQGEWRNANAPDWNEQYQYIEWYQPETTWHVTSLEDEFPITDGALDPSKLTEGTLRWALANAKDDDTVVFDDSIKGGTIKMKGVLDVTPNQDTSFVIKGAIVIEGNGVTIDGGWNLAPHPNNNRCGTRIFLTEKGHNKTTIRNLNLVRGHGTTWNQTKDFYFGGAINAGSPIRLENCQLVNNCSADYTPSDIGGTPMTYPDHRGGGAITAEDDVEIVSCFFGTNCIPQGSSSCGGAIRQAGGTLTVTDTVFDHDYSASYGGGIAYLGAAATGATFKNCKFIENSCASGNNIWGGAICSDMGNGAELKFFGCVFRGGSGASQGGAIYCKNQVTLLAVNCEFADSYTSFGGAVYACTTKPLLFLNCTFLGNAAATWGGAMEITDKDLCLVNCTIAGSYCAANNGGGLYASKGLHLLNTVFGYNYWGSSMEFNDGNQSANTSLRSLYKGVSTAPFGSTYTLATSLDEVPSATKLFANYQMVSDMHGAGATGARVQLPKPVVMPTFAEDPKSLYSSRVIGIKKDSVLNAAGYPVRVNADYSYVEYSEDGGATWKQFFKLENGVDTANMTPIVADQRGVPYKNGIPPIGAAAPDPTAGLMLLVR